MSERRRSWTAPHLWANSLVGHDHRPIVRSCYRDTEQSAAEQCLYGHRLFTVFRRRHCFKCNWTIRTILYFSYSQLIVLLLPVYLTNVHDEHYVSLLYIINNIIIITYTTAVWSSPEGPTITSSGCDTSANIFPYTSHTSSRVLYRAHSNARANVCAHTCLYTRTYTTPAHTRSHAYMQARPCNAHAHTFRELITADT